MKKELISFLFILFLCNVAFAQNTKYQIFNIRDHTDPMQMVTDIHFVNELTGFVGGYVNLYNNGTLIGWKVKLFKTSDGGASWENKYQFNRSFISSAVPKSCFSFVNENLGYFNQWGINLKTTDCGENWIFDPYLSHSYTEYVNNVMKYTSNNAGYLIQHLGSVVYKSVTGEWNMIKEFGPTIKLLDIEVSEIDNNTIYICGYSIFSGGLQPVFAKSINGGTTWQFIYNGTTDPLFVAKINDMVVVNNNGSDLVKLSGENKFLEYNGTNAIEKADWIDNSRKTISFENPNYGYYLGDDGTVLDNETIIREVYKTTDGGTTWMLDLSEDIYGSFNTLSSFYSKGEITYFVKSEGSQPKFYARRLLTNCYTYLDNVSSTGSFYTNMYAPINVITPAAQYLRGGLTKLLTDNILNSGQNNERIFYSWQNGDMRNNVDYVNIYYFNTENTTLSTHYKTKQISNSSNAISNANLTKSIRDVNGVVHQIHSSIGGIFYSRSTNNGQSFSREEILNLDLYGYTAHNNVNPSITEYAGYSTNINSAKNILGCWQRTEGSDLKIKMANRQTVDNINYYWQHIPSEYHITLSNAANFDAKPKAFGIKINNLSDNPPFILATYLKPDGQNKKLIVNHKTYATNQTEYEIASGNITDYAVTEKYDGNVMELHFTYVLNGQVYYCFSKFSILGLYDNHQYFTVSSGDGNFYNRNSVDISLRNGKPVITYAARNDVYKIIAWDGQEGGGLENPDGMNLNFYPIIVRYKEANGNWSIFYKYNSNGTTTQQNPDVEGSKDNAAHLINFSVNNSQFKQFVKIDGQTGYYCSPATFNGTDAKLVKGSYIGQTGANSYPTLLTLSPQSNLYTVGKQSFSITNDQNPISDIDAFSNLFGTMEMDNAVYCYNIGPIYVKNQFLDLEDPKNSAIIESVSEFNENMVSDVFQLANGDTLILGAYGLYRPQDNFNEYSPVRYRLNLINNSTQSLDRILFEDTISSQDSVEIQFLRGYVINDLPYTDSFYVQIEVNPDDGGDGDGFAMGGGYDDPAGGEGDNSGSVPKMKVFFENDFTPSQNSSIIPTEYKLNQNYPNPFNPATTISFDLPKDSRTNLIVYDITGKEIARLVNNEMKQAGRYNITFNAMNLASGIYFYRIQAGDFVQTKRMVLVK